MSSIRKVTDDAKMRPFLSTHFDAQAYIKTVIKDGRSEECFQTISTCIDEVNEEIKGYISQNKESLMSGMQDVAQLSERYSNLYSTSQKLQRNVERLKKEALESYDLVKLRTEELERIHSTSMVLRQLRQFVHCKAQLDHLLKATNEADGGASGGLVLNGDIRHLASAAKSLHELEVRLGVVFGGHAQSDTLLGASSHPFPPSRTPAGRADHPRAAGDHLGGAASQGHPGVRAAAAAAGAGEAAVRPAGTQPSLRRREPPGAPQPPTRRQPTMLASPFLTIHAW